ncbi:MAG TPA: pyridoxamine 5'-phosphate oxidase family protein [Candidatus Bathyarchaeia archaeon]|nr:pyridoxamine 5'-phosphate oxidase family protein [Candidatus Bathyarchaeia archaeon]
MKQEEFNKIAKDIIKNNIYLTLATADGDPWIAPLYYCIDDKYHFYYISQMDSVHTRQIFKNSKVAFAIFDSCLPEGKGNGIQASGIVYFLKKDKEIKQALKWYSTTYIECKPESFKSSAPYRLFKIVPEKFYILDPNAPIDKRVEVFLNPRR